MIVRISKIIFTKNGHYFKKVKYLRKEGIFQVSLDDKYYIFCDKKEVKEVSELFEYIEKKRLQWERNRKIENLLD